ncbi:arabinose import ATP-binding AraG domain protein [Escherichia coli 2-011-08_S3_C1]|nr:L-arabinose ABC transporter ATP-binding protein AraG [Escherichia coli]KDS99883.1 arabinose import ATP-binding AraG domain protein [Escherichia coli 2-011-08_S3_C1]KEM74118.1 arabinose import ATP-binding AraG domain protein [Escherichia coli 7-233-03_S3_C1]KEM74423.1 arabinose import ATP-binding AraG domain protein [Escherichia coli 7-233-03_S3_C1]KEM82528.1 arabinose import ATP-binding AraG domain protein [Escherichia coli 7-233-03_S3_C1]KEN05223.1 arabinose import ATP-binding AraG domain 
MQQSTPYLSFRGIGKTFPGVKALTDISFDCYAGQVHALMGENGAGKSTLLKILSGNYAPTTGSVVINGQEMSFSDTTAALNAGVAIIYQELHLVPEMTVAENIYLGQLPHKGGIVNRSLLNYEAGLQLKHLGMDIDPDTPLKYLSIGQWQMVEIAKALARNAKIIAFDEPTSSLSAREIDNLFRVIRELRKEGRGILYVSHRMEEIFALSDAITVFKDGRYVKTFTDMQQVDHDALVQAMVGRDIGDIYGWQPRSYGEERLRLDAVKAPGVRTPISLAVRSGEIVGLFGLVGAGRSELMKGLFGGTQITAGQVYIDQQPIDIRKPSHAIAAGMMLCPEDRKAEGIIPVHSVRDNINISARRKHVLGGCVINNGWEENNADHHIRSLNIKTPGAEQLIMNLSGGNQQKAILGRWLSEEMKVILLDEPTRGIDVGAKHEIYNVIYALAAQGVAVLFIACAIFVPNFATFINMKGLGLAISMSGMVACGMLFCLASGDFDLSVASVIACAGVTTAVVINLTESLWIGVAAGLLLGILCGLVNGFVIAKLKINALITTLATMQIVRGLAYIISDGKAVGIEDESFFALGYANWFGLPAPIWLTVACLIIFGLLLNKTTFGRNTLAIGGNEEAARLAGVPVVRTKIIIFVLSGLVSAIAGIILASRMTSGQPMTSIGYELIVISACVLGGVSLKGGIGKISYVVAGILILGTVENAMNLLNISPFAQYVVRGLILLAAVIFDRYKQKAKRTV